MEKGKGSDFKNLVKDAQKLQPFSKFSKAQII